MWPFSSPFSVLSMICKRDKILVWHENDYKYMMLCRILHLSALLLIFLALPFYGIVDLFVVVFLNFINIYLNGLFLSLCTSLINWVNIITPLILHETPFYHLKCLTLSVVMFGDPSHPLSIWPSLLYHLPKKNFTRFKRVYLFKD